MRILIVAGTRPELIKIAPLIKAFQNYSDLDLVFIHSGQHYSERMSDIFLQELGLPDPDDNIHVGSGSHALQTAKILIGCEPLFQKYKPDLVLSEGDTNTVLASSLAAVKMGIPYGHVEAGLRCYDKKMPEEINRVIADHNAALCFAPTEPSALNLVHEGIPPKRIFITGNTIVDACLENLEKARSRSKIIGELDIAKDDKIILLTCHRAENTDNIERLKNITKAVNQLKKCTVVFPVHPRTQKILMSNHLWEELKRNEWVKCVPPLGYFDFLLLLSKSIVVLTDSGGVQEEAISLKVPCLTLRHSTERPETVKAGANILVDVDVEKIVTYVNNLLSDEDFRKRMIPSENPYGDGHAGEKIARICKDKLHEGLEYETPTYIKNVSRDYLLLDAQNLKGDKFELICFFDQDGRPVFPSETVKPAPKWKALVFLRGDND
jgi:UDP-N-acetylglucosamine 2-epimerase (non-hydrolysing)